MEILLILLGAALFAAMIWLFLLKRDIRQLSKRIKEAAESDEAEFLEKEAMDFTPGDLVESVNIMLEGKQHDLQERQRVKSTLREAIIKIANNNKLQASDMLNKMQAIFTAEADIDTQVENLENVKEQLTNLIMYSDKLIEYADVIEGNVRINIRQNNICNILRETLSERRVELSKKGISVYGEIPEDPIIGLCDDEVLKRVLRYLLRNVCIHGKETMGVSLVNGIIEISNKSDELGNIDVANIFDVFTETSATSTSKNMGLGLAISKGLIELMKGRISAEISQDLLIIKIKIPILASSAVNPGKAEDYRVKT